MISEIHTPYGSFARLHGKSLAYAAYHLSKAGTSPLILRVSIGGNLMLCKCSVNVAIARIMVAESGAVFQFLIFLIQMNEMPGD
jgi:hypothetical protein